MDPTANEQAEATLHYRLLDLDVPGTMPITKLSLMPNRQIAVTALAGHMGMFHNQSPPRGRWRAPHATSLETFFEYRNTRATHIWIRLDGTNCFQHESTPEMMLIPWSDERRTGPTVQSRAFAQAPRTT